MVLRVFDVRLNIFRMRFADILLFSSMRSAGISLVKVESDKPEMYLSFLKVRSFFREDE